MAPAPPPADPVVAGDPDAVADCDESEGDDTDGTEDVGTLRGPDPTARSLLFAGLALLFV